MHKAKMIEAKFLDCCDRLTDAMSMQAMDRRAIEELGLPGLLLMENAARAVADWVEPVSYTHLTLPTNSLV